jgi:hypothetical protein
MRELLLRRECRDLARPLPTDRVTGHDSYLVPGSGALAALTRIVLTGQT